VGWILLRAARLAGRGQARLPGRGGQMAVTVRVAREEPGEASLELWCDHPADGQFLGSVVVPCTGGRYTWTEVSADMTVAEGIRDLYIVLRGRQRLASIQVAALAGGQR
jgi:beta-glucosidase